MAQTEDRFVRPALGALVGFVVERVLYVGLSVITALNVGAYLAGVPGWALFYLVPFSAWAVVILKMYVDAWRWNRWDRRTANVVVQRADYDLTDMGRGADTISMVDVQMVCSAKDVLSNVADVVLCTDAGRFFPLKRTYAGVDGATIDGLVSQEAGGVGSILRRRDALTFPLHIEPGRAESGWVTFWVNAQGYTEAVALRDDVHLEVVTNGLVQEIPIALTKQPNRRAYEPEAATSLDGAASPATA